MTARIRARAVSLARKEVGYKEGPRNWSKFARDSFPDVQNQAWCGSFVGDVYRRAGFDLRPHVWIPFVPYVETWAKKHGFWNTTRAQAGDLVVYGFGKSSAQHIGIAWPDEATGGNSYRAIEGNTSSGDRGSQSNGDGVYVRWRTRSTIRGWVDMDKVMAHYGVKDVQVIGSVGGAVKVVAPSKPSRSVYRPLAVDGKVGPATVQALQRFLRSRGQSLTVDGKAGHGTWRALQRYLRTPADGIVSSQPRTARQVSPAGSITQGWQHAGKGARGSSMVRALQKWVGVTVDGKWGPDTTRGLQRKLNAHKVS